MWREVSYTFIGLTMFFASKTFWKRTHVGELGSDAHGSGARGGGDGAEDGGAGGDYGALERDGALDGGAEEASATSVGDAFLSIGLFLRTATAMLAFFVHLTGIWTLLDSYILDYADVYRNWTYVLLGTILMVGSGTIQLHAGVYREAAVGVEREAEEAEAERAHAEEHSGVRSASLDGREALLGAASPPQPVESGEV